jgi:hypothetical protein
MKLQEVLEQLSKTEQKIVSDYMTISKEKDPQKLYKRILGLKEGKVKFESLEWFVERMNRIQSFGKAIGSLEAYKTRYGNKLGQRKYDEHIAKNSEANSGSNNAMAGISMKQRLINKYGDNADAKFEEFRQNVSKVTSGKNNSAYGKTNREYCFNAWQKKGLTLAECEEKYKHVFDNRDLSGEKNGMYGKPSPHLSGIGWSGLYKNTIHFRSLMELSYMVYLDENKISWVSAEGKIRIKYYDEKGKARTYSPDFIINKNEVIEVKPEKLKNVLVNVTKFEAGRQWCENNNYQYKVVTPDYLSDDVIYNMWKNNVISFSNKVEQKVIKYFMKKRLISADRRYI